MVNAADDRKSLSTVSRAGDIAEASSMNAKMVDLNANPSVGTYGAEIAYKSEDFLDRFS
jgi:hypothetical protein